MGLFTQLKAGLKKTQDNLTSALSGSHLNEEFFDELEMSLITSDVGAKATERILQRLRARVKEKGLKTPDEAKLELRDEIALILKPAEKTFLKETQDPSVLMLVGVNGAGKTTSIGKIAKYLSQDNKTVLLAAGDTFRAAAREQLIHWGEKNNITVISQKGGDPAAVAFDAISSAKAKKIDVAIVDTAGRLPTQNHLMQELTRIHKAVGKALAGAPHDVVLVLDGTTGQNAIVQLIAFDAAVPLTGLIVTKLDGTAKGGILLSLCALREGVPLPIYFVGVGEGIDDLKPFNARAYANALLGIEEDTHE